jgi:hypothetical protein
MMNTRWAGLAAVSSVFLRLALGISFLSAVADRFGFWGVYGQPNVAWGNYARYVAYTAKLNWFLPAATIPALAIIATAAEILFGLLLVLGWKTRTIALLKWSSSDNLCTGDDVGFEGEGAPRFVGLFSCRRCAAPGNIRKFPAQLRRIGSAE